MLPTQAPIYDVTWTYLVPLAIPLLLLRADLRRILREAGPTLVAFAVVSQFLAPVVLAPIFNDFEPLPDGPDRRDVLSLADRAEVEIGEVYRIDASSRRTSLNAYVGGFGSTRRVVIYDNLLDSAERPALRSVAC